MKTIQPQYELPGAETAFNLAGETGMDPDRVAAEIEKRKADAEEAKKITEQQQPEML